MRSILQVSAFIAMAGGLSRRSLAQNIIWEIEASNAADRLAIVSVGPDVSGDGVSELLLGYIYETCSSTSQTGVVREFSTNSGQLEQWCGDNPAAGGDFGAPVGWLDDVDGRGEPDIIIGQPGYKDPYVGSQTGRLQVYSGEDASLIYEIVGTLPYGRFGYFDVCDDVDGDGLRDFIVGAFDYGASSEGLVWVYSAKAGIEIRRHAGTSAYQQLGSIVRGIGDADGDGVGDYAMAAYKGDAGGFEVRSGSTGVLIHLDDGESGQGVGRCIAKCGDLDGDGNADILCSIVINGNNAVEAYSPMSGALIWTVSSSSSGDHLGARMAASGDQNSDGVEDYLLAALYDDHDSKDSGRVDLISGVTLRALYRFYPDTVGARYFGEILTRGSDFNGDGIEDLVMGTTDGGGLSKQAGIVQIRAGNDLWLQADPIAPVDGDTVTVDLRGAVPGVLGLIALTAIDGTAVFETLLLAPFDTNGELQFCADVDSSVSGMEFTLMAYAQNKPGRGPLRDATPFIVKVQ